jgi:hypothetical protein
MRAPALALVVLAITAHPASGVVPPARAERRATQTAGGAAPVAELTHSAPAAKQAPSNPAPSGSPHAQRDPAASLKRAPTAPPLGTGPAGVSAEAEASSSAPPSGGDPLAANGLNSPLCRDGAAADLAASAARDCRTSGFEAAQAPSGDYAFDVHIDTGLTQWGGDTAATAQNMMQFGWTTLVAAVHGVIVMLDWCFTIDLLDSPAMSGLTRGLHATQATFTRPWLVIVLAIASMLAAYHGLIRRRIAETVGEALLTLAMMVGGLWVIANPTGTVGALGGWANEASLGTLGAVMAGTPDHPDRTLAEGNQNVFSAAIEGPWCYLEFGDVSWCEDAARLDPRLRTAALKIAAAGGGDVPGQSAALLRGARTNGELFLALPANQVARNSVTTPGSLFNVLCGGEEEPCRGSTAAQAEFRTQSGTGARVIGLAFICLGLLGMLLVLGFLALRLLGAALMSLLYLLLAPAAVLAPALGEGGRAAFRAWATRLLGAVTSKLLFSFLLGAVLAVERVLSSVRVFGWLTQWLLISSLWWMVFRHRHLALGFAHGERRDRGGRDHSLPRRAHEALGTTRAVLENASWARRTFTRRASSVERRNKLAQASDELAREQADRSRETRASGANPRFDQQVTRSLELGQREARALVQDGPRTQARVSAMRARLQRVGAQRERASAESDTPRAVKLGVREQRLAGTIAREEEALRQARRVVAEGERTKRRTGETHTREQREEHARFLDAQAALPAAGRAARSSDGAPGERRDYAALAGLVGRGRSEYERLDPRHQREARREIDRELALRRELAGATAQGAEAAGTSPVGRGDRRRVRRELDRVLGERLPASAEGYRRPRGPGGGSRVDAWKREGAAAASSRAQRRGSPVLEDAREVAARRKRQLGWDRR